jgi:hypothetical protein
MGPIATCGVPFQENPRLRQLFWGWWRHHRASTADQYGLRQDLCHWALYERLPQVEWKANHCKTTWAQFKTQFSAAYRQHKQMQGESAATSGYHAANADVGQT